MTEFTKRAHTARSAQDILDPDEAHGPNRSLHTLTSGKRELVYHENDIVYMGDWAHLSGVVPDSIDDEGFDKLLTELREDNLLHVEPTVREKMMHDARIIPGSLFRFHVGLQFQDVHHMWHSCFQMLDTEGYAVGIRDYQGRHPSRSWLPMASEIQHTDTVSRFIEMCQRNVDELHGRQS